MIIVKDSEGNKRYGVEPFKDTCYQLYRWRDETVAEKGGKSYKKGDTIPEGWVALECYPTSLSFAFAKVYEKMLHEGMKPERGFKSAITEANAIADSVISSVRVLINE